MRPRTNTSNYIQLILVIGVLLLLWQLLRQLLPTADVLPYIMISLLSILTFIVKSRFK